MKKLRTVDQLNDMLDEAFVWRRQELGIIKSLIKSGDAIQQKSLVRSGVAILYAHWEGFVKEAGGAYLNFVSMQRLKYEELAPNFIALSMKAKLNEATQTNQSQIYTEVVQFFLSDLSKRSQIPRDSEAINTESNLKSQVFHNIIHLLGLDYREEYKIKEHLIDEQLLSKRNDIAHGKYLGIEIEDYFYLHDEVIGLMELFRNQVINAALEGSYKR